MRKLRAFGPICAAVCVLSVGQAWADITEIDTTVIPGNTIMTGLEFEDQGVILTPIGGGLNIVTSPSDGCIGSHTDTAGLGGDFDGDIRLTFVDPDTMAPTTVSFISVQVVNQPVMLTAYDEDDNVLGTDTLTMFQDFLTVTAPGIHHVDIEGSFWCIAFSIQFELEESDTTPPVVDCELATDLLWPPNHELVDVGLEVTVVDDQDDDPDVEVLVFSDEDDDEDTGSGNTSPDAAFDGETLELRSERSGNNDGRVYLIVVIATDEAGNQSFTCCTVVVPKSNSKKSLADVDAQAAAAEAYCAEFGAEPPGYVPVGE